MILVAAIAASVFIQTATSLQNKALLAGSRTREQISTGFSALLMYGTDGSNGNIEELRLKLKLTPGSEPVKFNETLVEVSTKNSSYDLSYNTSACSDANTNTINYMVEYLITSTNHQDGSILNGEVAMLCFETPHSMERDEELAVRVIPKYAQSLVIETAVPEMVYTTRVFIFP